jgi:hypothetical protein
MIDSFIGNYERVIGRNGYIKENEKYIPCKISGYLFKNRKYQVKTQDGISRKVKKVYIDN